ncbi:MAG: hypothetical protein R6W90_05185 [Ignavibacteriaceae bacterium]
MRNVVSKLSAILVAILFFSASLLAQDQTGQEEETGQDQIEQETQTGQQDQTEDQMGQDQTTEEQDQTTMDNQQFESSAQQLTDNLATTITLTDEQKSDVKEAISEYYGRVIGTTSQEGTVETTGSVEEADQWLNDEIAGILDDAQQAQWDVAKADFWNQLRDNVASMQQGDGNY